MTKRLQSTLAAALACLAAACASMAERTVADYHRGDASERQYQQDAAACGRQAETNQKAYGMGEYDPTHGSYNWMYDVCMRSSGYERKQP